MKYAFLGLTLTVVVLLAASGARAADLAQGHWLFDATGMADRGTPSPDYKACSAPNPMPFTFYNGEMDLNNGSLTVTKLDINIGYTNCYPLNFTGRGLYSTVDKGGGHFDVLGLITSLSAPVSNSPACNIIALKNVMFTIYGNVSGSSTITIDGVTDFGTYGESPSGPPNIGPYGPLICKAPIPNMSGSGSASHL